MIIIIRQEHKIFKVIHVCSETMSKYMHERVNLPETSQHLQESSNNRGQGHQRAVIH